MPVHKIDLLPHDVITADGVTIRVLDCKRGYVTIQIEAQRNVGVDSEPPLHAVVAAAARDPNAGGL